MKTKIIFLLIALQPLLIAAQSMRWQRMKPFTSVELKTQLDTTDVLLIQDSTGAFKYTSITALQSESDSDSSETDPVWEAAKSSAQTITDSWTFQDSYRPVIINNTSSIGGMLVYFTNDGTYVGNLQTKNSNLSLTANSTLTLSGDNGGRMLYLSESGMFADLDNASTSYSAFYNPTTKEITYATAADGTGTSYTAGDLIDISSSIISVDIPGATALTSGLSSTDELAVSDNGIAKRMDVSVLQDYMQNNLTFSTSASASSDYVEWFSFESSATGCNGYSGTVSGATLGTGYIGNCYEFGGSSSVSDAITINDININASSYVTIAFWAYHGGDGAGDLGRPFSLYNSSDNSGVILPYMVDGPGDFWFRIPGWSTTEDKWYYEDWSEDVWQHWVFVYNTSTPGDLTAYLNGSEVSFYHSQTGAGTLDISTCDLIIGNNSGVSRAFDGKIDEFVLYNKALTSEEVTALYETTSSCTFSSGSPSVTADGVTNALSYSSGNLTVSTSNGDNYTADISDLYDNTDEQTLTVSGTTLTISSGNSVTLPTSEGTTDGVANALSYSSGSLTVSTSNGDDYSADISDLYDNTDEQTLSISGTTLTISSGNSVTLPTSEGTTDGVANALSYSAGSLTVSTSNGDDYTADISDLYDNTDEQTLSISGTTLAISSGNSVTIPEASESTAGALSASDKATINALGSMSEMGFWSGKASDYNALTSYSTTTIYFIEEEEE